MGTEEQAIQSVWTRPRKGREQPALSRAQIVAEAIKLLDAEGLEALSMRRLGTRLGAGATSLYRHVTNREELIELVVDEVYGENEVPAVEDPAQWRAAAAVCAHGVRSMILRHPWVASVLGQVGLSYLGPNVMRLNDRVLTLFETAGFPLEEADQAISTLISYVIGMGTAEAAWLTSLARSGKTEQEWVRALRPAAEEATKEYPRLQEMTTRADQDPAHIREVNFQYGLDRVLDGLQTRL
jgi:AcrR family transcriptional regulator